MPSLNKVILMGNMVAEPELKQTPSGVAVCSFRIGVQRRFKDANGTYASDFINIVAWRQQAEFVARYFHKGSSIIVVGSIQSRDYTDQQGNKRYVTEVVADECSFGSAKGDGTGAAPAFAGTGDAGQTPYYAPQSAPAAAPAQQPAAPKFEDIGGDEDLPF
ncbi:MAG: single-stranded DNA-binding protein [Clostridia bacterium]|nr:single-stranded DNA-binding protein [Clostridia bacterium]